jgi:hypothetical protein
MALNEAEIAARADASVFKDALKLVSSGWSDTATNGQAAWGKIKGSAADPYMVCIDLSAPPLASRCTCPSRKFPCKHAVALALRCVRQPKVFPQREPPAFVQAWLASRAASRARQQSDDAPKSEPGAGKISDAAKQAAKDKTAAARERKVAAGLDDLRLRLSDVVRRGLGDERLRGYKFWDDMAKRMVDAQAGGIAARLREIGGMMVDNERLPQALDALGRLYLLADCYPRLSAFPPGLQAEMRALIGFTIRKEDVLNEPGMRDVWSVISVEVEQDASLLTRRTWLHGAETGQWALLLDFAAGGQSFEATYHLGDTFNGELVYYPAAFPQRALIRHRGAPLPSAESPPHAYATIADALNAYSNALAQSPWLERFPLMLNPTWVEETDRTLYLRDSVGDLLPLPAWASGFPRWVFRAASGGAPIAVFGEWDGFVFRCLTLFADGCAYSFTM